MRTFLPGMTPRRTAGILLLAGSLIVLAGMILAQSQYPGYSLEDNYISDLGNFAHPVPAILFNTSIVIFGAMAVYAGLLVRDTIDRWLGVLVALAGAGAVGVGVFSEGTVIAIHAIAALTVFSCGSLAIFRSAQVLYGRPVSYVFAVLGCVAVFSLALLIFDIGTGRSLLGIGIGGVERLVALPIVIWTVATGIFLAARTGKDRG